MEFNQHHISGHYSEQNQINVDIILNIAYNIKKEFPKEDEIGENL